MLYVETDSKDAAFHFSVEEYIMKSLPVDEPVMMIWQTGKCAMLGSYQVAEAEIDMRYAKEAGIQVVRRPSGGGTIFTDLGTFLYTMIQPYEQGIHPLQIARDTVAPLIVFALNEMGVPAKAEGRNDILLEGKKISGMAQYIRHGKICSHGSLLYDTDLEALASALKVDEEKISSKALRSIRSRVTNIKEHMKNPCEAGEFEAQLKEKLHEGREMVKYTLTKSDLSEIESIFREKYGNPEWTFGKSPEFSFNNGKRFSGGKVEVSVDVKEGAVAACFIRGDFLGTVPISGLEGLFKGRAFRREAFVEALEGVELHYYLGSVTSEEFLSVCF